MDVLRAARSEMPLAGQPSRMLPAPSLADRPGTAVPSPGGPPGPRFWVLLYDDATWFGYRRPGPARTKLEEDRSVGGTVVTAPGGTAGARSKVIRHGAVTAVEQATGRFDWLLPRAGFQGALPGSGRRGRHVKIRDHLHGRRRRVGHGLWWICELITAPYSGMEPVKRLWINTSASGAGPWHRYRYGFPHAVRMVRAGDRFQPKTLRAAPICASPRPAAGSRWL